MVLHELHGVLLKTIPDDLRKWIKLLLVDDDWTDILAFSDEREEELMRQASSKGVLLTKQTVDPEQFKVNDLDLVRDRFTYLKGFTADIRKTEKIFYACSEIPQMCQSVENLFPFMEEKCLSFPDDSIKEVEESQDVHHSMHLDDGAKIAKKARVGECSEMDLKQIKVLKYHQA